jgi:hypothetical protein
MSMLHDLIRDERQRRKGTKPMIVMRVLVEPILSPDGDHIGRRQLDTEASAVIAGRGGDRIWQRADETITAFEARVEAMVSAVA